MIITKTPYRISLFGGGSDYPQWYRYHGGKVLSFSIDKYCYISVRQLLPFFPKKYKISYSKVEVVDNPSEIKHPAIREAIRNFGPEFGLELQHQSDLPAQSGVGSSSAFAVGVINALTQLKGVKYSNYQLANLAINLEQDFLKENVGSQDQIACAIGGFNLINFFPNLTWDYNPIKLSKTRKKQLVESLVLIFSGISRKSSDVAASLITNLKSREGIMRQNVRLVDESIKIIESGSDLQALGELLDKSWSFKAQLNPQSINAQIHFLYSKALECGASGGKILGAGGGGFLLFWVQPEIKREFLERYKYGVQVPFDISEEGAQTIFNSESEYSH